MIHIGRIKSVDGNVAVVQCDEMGVELEALILQVLGNATDNLIAPGEQVAVWVQDGRNVLLGAVYSQHSTPNLTTLFAQLIDILKNIKVSTPTGPSGTPLPDVVQKINDFEKDFKTFLNVE